MSEWGKCGGGMCLWGMAVVLCVVAGCATPNLRGNTSPVRMASLKYGMSERKVARTLRAKGDPVFAFVDEEGTWVCKRAFLPSTGFFYYLLWADDELRGIHGEEEQSNVEECSGFGAAHGGLPHEEGFEWLKRVFDDAPAEPGEIDYWQAKEYWYPGKYWGTPGEYLMWSPIALLGLPFTVPSIAAGEVTCRQMYRLRLGMSPEEVRVLAGKPERELGDPEAYGIWICTRCILASDGDMLSVSVGFRENEAVWIRYEYDAYVDWSRHGGGAARGSRVDERERNG